MELSKTGEPRKKIAFIKRGLFSYSNVRTGEQLRKHFPEYDIEELDVVADLLKKHPLITFANLLCTLWQYWPLLRRRRCTIDVASYRTPYIFRKIRSLVRARLTPRLHEFAFTLQTQSLYDASLPGLPHIVYTDHTHLVNLTYPGYSPRDLYTPAWIALEREIYQHAAHICVMSPHVRASLIDQYDIPPSRTTCIYAGSNIDPTPVPLQNDGYTNQTILFIGIDWQRKGGPTLLAAFHLILAQLPAARLVIIGCDPGITHPRITITGRIPREQVKEHLTRATLFCLPTRIEPFGIAVVEAFHHALPVVATNIGAMPGLIIEGETGHLVPPEDPPALAHALLTLLRDPEKCRRFGELGRLRMAADYTWDAAGAKLRQAILPHLLPTKG